jgi:enamine deaminase RidA (YjgF/YER057c/UK114 family)
MVATANGATSSATVAQMTSSSPTPRRLISSGSTFERDIGYSRAVVVGDRVIVAGTTGFDYARMTISDDVAVQAAPSARFALRRRCLRRNSPTRA